MENSKQIKKISEKGIKAIKVIKIICYSLAGIIIALSIGVFAIEALDLANPFIKEHLEEMQNVTVNITHDHGFIELTEKVPLLNLYEEGEVNAWLTDVAADMMSAGITLLITAILLQIFQKLFVKLNNSESPFSLEILKDVRNVFIVITIFVALKSVIMGIIVGLCLYCFYFIYKRGIDLQKESDETI